MTPEHELVPDTDREPGRSWPAEAETLVACPHPVTRREPALERSSRSCRCGAPLARHLAAEACDPWTCAALLLGAAEPGQHDELEAFVLALSPDV